MNIDEIKNRNPLRSYVQMYLGNRKNGNAKYDAYRCPFHGEQKGASLIVWDEYWQCFGKCQIKGDVIDFAMRYHDVRKKEAMIMLGGDATAPRAPRPETQPRPVIEDMPPSDDWQYHARRIVDIAQDTLWSPKGARALDWLRYHRWLHDDVIRGAKLGYVQGNYDQWVTPFDNWLLDGKRVSVPCGITIPHFADGDLWGIRVRRAGGDIKYQGVRGGKRVLYGVDGIEPGLPVMIWEGEFDRLVNANLWRHRLVSPVALCGASNTALSRWLPKLITVPRIYARMDDDSAGKRALEKLMGMSESVIAVQVPEGKDATDYVELHGLHRLLDWLKDVVKNEQKIEHL